MSAHGRKNPRQFHCSDALWETYRRMSSDQEKSVDELINDALESYAQLAGYQTGIDAEPAFATSHLHSHNEEGPATPPPAHPPRRPPPPPAPPPSPMSTRFGRGTPSSPSAFGGVFPSTATPPPLAPSYIRATDGTPGVPAPPLYLVFDNQKYRIDKDQFIIGRGAKSSDLPIKDGNISRKHAAVVRRNGTYFIKDLGSTNGIDFKGMRIDNKRIDEGDVFHLCDYELRFTYKR
jgi:hypothetical protein